LLSPDSRLIMIVDDDENQRKELAFFATRMGYRTSCFASGEEMLGAILNGAPDLIVMDINLPARDGIRIAEIASSIDHRIRICFLSGSQQRRDEAWDRQLGSVFSKPLTFEMFQHLLPASHPGP
jgi:CheY-like chemotaxis protein